MVKANKIHCWQSWEQTDTHSITLLVESSIGMGSNLLEDNLEIHTKVYKIGHIFWLNKPHL